MTTAELSLVHGNIASAQRAWVEIDTAALVRNAARMQQRAAVPIIAMVKADGYGHGLNEVARALASWSSANTIRNTLPPLFGLGTATLAESLQLREQLGADIRILCCPPLMDTELEDARRANITPSLHRIESIRRWHALGGGAWHLAIDTGMQRAGVRWDNVAALRDIVHAHPPEAVYSHFHSAEIDDGSREQQESRFDDACAELQLAASRTRIMRHLDNSAGIRARVRASHDLVRPGLSLYGGGSSELLPLEQVATVRARVIDMHELQDGDTVSYGATWRADGVRRIATLGIGHGDGYRQQFGNRSTVLLNGQRVPVVGVVSMDMTMVDVTAIDCSVGDIATMLGADHRGARISPEELAASGGISVYELFIGLRLRLPRIPVHSDPPSGATTLDIA